MHAQLLYAPASTCINAINNTHHTTKIWRKPLSHNGSKFAVLLLNLHPEERDISLSMTQLGYSANATVSLEDVWTGDDRGRVKGDAVYVARKIPGHGSVFSVTGILDPK